ncbi:MAG: cytochrome c biogenesis protein CcdA, partial [Myxococcota bacterium]|nr:cytochrome c biogenesis protein CcdA [Myxococcota bacterium]
MTGYDEYFAKHLSGAIESGHFAWSLLAACVGGLLTSFTPCVYPLIPITIRFFGGMQKEKRTSVRRLALVYVLGMMFLYTLLGTIFASLNLVFGSFLSHKGVLWGIVALCIAMGISMLGGFSLQLPMTLNTRASRAGGRSMGGAFVMGMVSGLIAAPCTGPVLAVILTLIASTGELFFGFFLMVSFSLGLGCPFLVLALSSTALQNVPGSGRWMELVKIVLAAAMFVVAAYFLQFAWPEMQMVFSLIPRVDLFILVLALLGFGSVFLLFKTKNSVVELRAMWGGAIFFSAALIFGLWGGESKEKTINWYTEHDRALSEAL